MKTIYDIERDIARLDRRVSMILAGLILIAIATIAAGVVILMV